MFAIHGNKDELVPYDQATELVAAFKKSGVTVELLTIQDGRHGSGGKPEDWSGAIVKAVEFFNQNLKRNR